MTSPDSPIVAATAAVAEVRSAQGDEAKPWGLRYGQVTAAPSTTVGVVQVVLDGDTQAIEAISLIGNDIVIGDRVAVMGIPPSGNYITSTLNASETVLDAIEGNVVATDTTAVGGAELNLARLAMSAINLRKNFLHRLDFQLITTRTVATNEFELRLRQDTALTGTILASALAWGTVGTAGEYIQGSMFWKQTTDVPSASLFLSLIRSSGAGTMTVFYQNFGALTRSIVMLKRMGPSSRLRTITT